MYAIFPSTALRTSQPKVKRAAQIEPVIITDNNSQQYLFMTEQEFARRLQNEADEAAYATRMARGIRRAKEGIARGEYVVGANAAIAQAQRMAHHE